MKALMDAKLAMSRLLVVLFFISEDEKYVVESYGTFTIENSNTGRTTKVYRNDEYFGWFSRGEVATYIMNDSMYFRSQIIKKD